MRLSPSPATAAARPAASALVIFWSVLVSLVSRRLSTTLARLAAISAAFSAALHALPQQRCIFCENSKRSWHVAHGFCLGRGERPEPAARRCAGGRSGRGGNLLGTGRHRGLSPSHVER